MIFNPFDPEGKQKRIYQYPTTFNKNTPLQTSPHYTDSCFDREQTVFGQEEKGLSYDYSDRIWQWDYDKAQEAARVAGESGAVPKSCQWYEVYLSNFFGRPVEIKHIIAGVNRSNGYPYCVFGYKDKRVNDPS